MDSALLETALRVLNAITARIAPDPQDATFLRDNAYPFDSNLELDDLACFIVQNELKKRHTHAAG